jgi:hypothetical protein
VVGTDAQAARCPCFESVAKDKTEEELKKILEEKLDVLRAH